MIDFLINEMKVKAAFPDIGHRYQAGFVTGQRARKAYQYAIDNNRKSVTLVHKNSIQKFWGGFRDWGYALAQREFGANRSTAARGATSESKAGRKSWSGRDHGCVLQQILLRPAV